MKKTILFGLTIAALTFTSCGGDSIEKDATTLANLACESIELLGKTDDASVKKAEELDKKGKDLEAKLDSKYAEGSEEAKKLQELVEKKLESCKAYQDMIKGFDDAFGDLDDMDFEDMDWGEFEDMNLEDFVEELDEE